MPHLVGKLDEETFMTIANHELKGAKAYLQTKVSGIHVALSCIVDYKGMRMIAMAFFPADGENTLVYGLTSKLIRTDDVAKKLLREARSKLNLKERIHSCTCFLYCLSAEIPSFQIPRELRR